MKIFVTTQNAKAFQNKTNELWAIMSNNTIPMEIEVHTFGEAPKKTHDTFGQHVDDNTWNQLKTTKQKQKLAL